jgi:hypothetical protein
MGVYMIILIHSVIIVSFIQIPEFRSVSMCAVVLSSVVQTQKLAPLYVCIWPLALDI